MTKHYTAKILSGIMSWDLSIKNIDFIRYLWRYLSIFLITPWYDFDYNAPYKPYMSKIYGTFIFSTKILSTLYFMLSNSSQRSYNFLYVTQKLNYTLCGLNLLIITSFTTLQSSFGDVNNWKKLFENFQYIDKELRNKGKTEKRLWKNFFFSFIIQQIIFIGFTFYQEYVWSHTVKSSFDKVLLIFPVLNYFFECEITVLLGCFPQIINTRYKELNKRLLKIIESPKITEELKRLVHYHRILGENIEIFNKIFRLQIVLIIFDCGMQIVIYVSIFHTRFMQLQMGL